MSDLTYKRNHEPHQQGEWFEYTGFRFKDYYDLELKDGTILKGCRPNATAWYQAFRNRRVGDEQVAKIRLVPDDELPYELCERGVDRVLRNLQTFGPAVPFDGDGAQKIANSLYYEQSVGRIKRGQDNG